MVNVKHVLPLCGLTLLGGCAAIHDTPQGLKQAGKAKHSFCSTKSFDQTVHTIATNLRRCFDHDVREMYAGSSVSFVERSQAADGTVTLASSTKVNWNHFYQVVVDIYKTDSCAVQVDAYGMSDAWMGTSLRVQDWVEDKHLDKCD